MLYPLVHPSPGRRSSIPIDGYRSKAESWTAGRRDEALWAQAAVGMETSERTRGDLVRTYTLEGECREAGKGEQGLFVAIWSQGVADPAPRLETMSLILTPRPHAGSAHK